MVYVKIVEKKTNTVVKKMGPMEIRKADSVASGVRINLNHKEYKVVVNSSPD